jgi:hypothetical protein
VEILIDATVAAGAVTVTPAVPIFPASNTDVAAIETLPALSAVATPVDVMLTVVASDDDQVTAVLAVLTTVTFAVNACVPPTASVADEGLTVTLVTDGVVVVPPPPAGGVTEMPPPPPQASTSAAAQAALNLVTTRTTARIESVCIDNGLRGIR